MLYWEDIPLFQAVVSPASYTLTADNIKGFATEWDPFPPHVDEAAAARSPVGSLSDTLMASAGCSIGAVSGSTFA